MTRALLVGALWAGLAGPAAEAQAPPSLEDLVTQWARGEWASPVYCRVDDKTVRGIRRVEIQPAGERAVAIATLEIRFVDMKVEDASRCFDTLGTDIANLIGRVQLRFNGTAPPETARREFERALKRKRGFDFDTPKGKLERTLVAQPPPPPERIDLARGKASLRVPAPGSNAARELADFRATRKLVLELSPRKGATIRIPLFQIDSR